MPIFRSCGRTPSNAEKIPLFADRSLDLQGPIRSAKPFGGRLQLFSTRFFERRRLFSSKEKTATVPSGAWETVKEAPFVSLKARRVPQLFFKHPKVESSREKPRGPYLRTLSGGAAQTATPDRPLRNFYRRKRERPLKGILGQARRLLCSSCRLKRNVVVVLRFGHFRKRIRKWFFGSGPFRRTST